MKIQWPFSPLVLAILSACSSDPDTTPATPDSGTVAETGAPVVDSGSTTPPPPATLEAGKATMSLTFSNRDTANVLSGAFEADAKESRVEAMENTTTLSGFPVGMLTTIGGKTTATGGGQFTLFIGEVKAGAVYETTGRPGVGGVVGYRAGFVEVHGSSAALWTSNDAETPAGKVTILTVEGKRFTFKVEGVLMAPGSNGNVDGKGTFTVDGTGEAVLP